MDYEKAYKDALERAREIYNDSFFKDGNSGHNLMERVFPELAESEDERIRERLITFFQQYPYEYIPNGKFSTRDAVAWLEKQKPDPRQQYLDALLYADDIYQMSMNDKMVEEAESKAVNALMEIGVTKLLLEKQKPVEWSEEDEREFQILNFALRNNGQITSADWLESIKERIFK